ncbi:outer membrane beta-barrel protein [Pedobacter sp. L105]|uniref:outer membrane beta-barrel protein n=1 Tax=Pedobacter sp. L105 TaxID=1641871 RepID=UPI001C2020BD|nr:outer membrane beta-barrel protein [Pedobacter sp. L105]
MKSIPQRVCLLLICILFHSIVYGQAVKSPGTLMPLADVLKQLTAHYQTNFLYEEGNVRDKKVNFSSETLKDKNIEQVLTGLLSPLGLSWYKIDTKNYSIFPVRDKKQSLKTETGQGISTAVDSAGTGKITGRVTDQKLQGLEFSTMTLLRAADSAVLKKVLSDTSASYLFTAVKAGEYRIRASSIGYHDAFSPKFMMEDGGSLTLPPLLIEALSKTLNEVKISASRAVVETKSDRFIFNVENSAMASGNSIQLLKSAPFVKVSADNTVSLQGKKTMVLIDNKPVPDASLESILETLPAGNIAKIELITQPSARYDAAYGAVINIITKKSQVDGLTGNIRAEGSLGEYGRSDINAAVTCKHKALTVFGTGGINRQDELFSINTEKILGVSATPEILQMNLRRLGHDKSYYFQAGADVELGKDQTIGLLVNDNVFKLNGPWTSVTSFHKQGSGIDSVLNTNSSFHVNQSTFTYNVNYHLLADSGKNELTFLTSLTPFRHVLSQDFPSVLLNSSGETIRTPATYQTINTTAINIYIAQVDYLHQFNHRWTIETGLKYQETYSKNDADYLVNNQGHLDRDPAFSSNSKLDEAISGAYGVLTKNWASDKLQAGLRVENTKTVYTGYYSHNYLNAFPALLYQHTFNADYNLSFSFKRTITRAPYYDLVPYTVFNNQYTIEQGNPALKPEYDNIYTISTNVHKLNISFNYTAGKGMFAMLPSKEDYVNNVTYSSLQNLNNSSDLNLNLFYPLQLTSWWGTQNSGAILGHNKVEGTILNASYALSGFYSDFKSAQIFTLSKKVKLQLDAYYFTSYKQSLSNYSGYKNIDAGLLIDLFNGKGQLRLSGNEIVFKRNDYHQDQYFTGYTSRQVYNTDSRRASIGFTYKFGKSNIKSSNKKLGNEDVIKRL